MGLSWTVDKPLWPYGAIIKNTRGVRCTLQNWECLQNYKASWKTDTVIVCQVSGINLEWVQRADRGILNKLQAGQYVRTASLGYGWRLSQLQDGTGNFSTLFSPGRSNVSLFVLLPARNMAYIVAQNSLYKNIANSSIYIVAVKTCASIVK